VNTNEAFFDLRNLGRAVGSWLSQEPAPRRKDTPLLWAEQVARMRSPRSGLRGRNSIWPRGNGKNPPSLLWRQT